MDQVEKLVLGELQKQAAAGENLLLAVSGGLDSTVMAWVLFRLKPILKTNQIAIAHIYHGDTEDLTLSQFRKTALKRVEALAGQLGFGFYTNGEACTDSSAQSESQSESKLRALRTAALSRIMIESHSDLLLTGHHADDLVETRLIRLLRGTGKIGFIAMRSKQGNVLRPLLRLRRRDLADYAIGHGIEFIDDPSNQNDRYLRNWLRRHWLGPLEEIAPGAMARMAASFEKIAEFCQNPDLSFTAAGLGAGLSRDFLRTLDFNSQRRILHSYLSQCGHFDLSQTQIDEVLKRLKVRRKQIFFRVGGLQFQVTERWIKIGAPE